MRYESLLFLGIVAATNCTAMFQAMNQWQQWQLDREQWHQEQWDREKRRQQQWEQEQQDRKQWYDDWKFLDDILSLLALDTPEIEEVFRVLNNQPKQIVIGLHTQLNQFDRLAIEDVSGKVYLLVSDLKYAVSKNQLTIIPRLVAVILTSLLKIEIRKENRLNNNHHQQQ